MLPLLVGEGRGEVVFFPTSYGRRCIDLYPLSFSHRSIFPRVCWTTHHPMKISQAESCVPTHPRNATSFYFTLRDDNILYTKFLQFQRGRNSCRASTNDQDIGMVHVTLRERTSRPKSLTCCDRDSSLPWVAQNCMQRGMTIKSLAASLHGACPPS